MGDCRACEERHRCTVGQLKDVLPWVKNVQLLEEGQVLIWHSYPEGVDITLKVQEFIEARTNEPIEFRLLRVDP